ncbi:MAG TPA: (Fe-S)-binding protein [Chryseolinea sp.]|nr:(Fe-S)-binding protein [Chryseolinea sp.]
MKVALFVPCYIDQFYPQVAIATLELLEKFGLEVSVPEKQTCCGQPMANSGFAYLSAGCDENLISSFADFDYVVCPSGSCTLHVKDHLHVEKQEKESHHIREHIKELTEFMTDVLHVDDLDATFPHKVGLHQSCHGQRGLKLSQMSELVAAPFSKPEKLLRMVKGIELIELDRRDECCGFGGTFCVTEEAVSVKMGLDRVADHRRHGAEYITAADMSCLMHLEGILRRQKSTTRVIHIAEILNATMS